MQGIPTPCSPPTSHRQKLRVVLLSVSQLSLCGTCEHREPTPDNEKQNSEKFGRRSKASNPARQRCKIDDRGGGVRASKVGGGGGRTPPPPSTLSCYLFRNSISDLILYHCARIEHFQWAYWLIDFLIDWLIDWLNGWYKDKSKRSVSELVNVIAWYTECELVCKMAKLSALRRDSRLSRGCVTERNWLPSNMSHVFARVRDVLI